MSVRELRAVDLCVSVDGRPVVRDIELVAPAGRWITITGASGSGKSILLQALAGLLPLSGGAVLVDGLPAWTGPHRQPPPGIVLQDDPLVPLLSAAESVSLPLQVGHAAKADIRVRTRDWLGALGLTASADQLVSTLSGGQRQRVALARTLAMGSRLLFLDEPTSELDAGNRHLVLTLLRRQVNGGAVLIAVSHDPAVRERSDAVVTLTPEGRLAS
jgi:putative ABC transport system ATP-binding protein